MPMKALQLFTPEYLNRCRGMTPEQIVRWLEDFRELFGQEKALRIYNRGKYGMVSRKSDSSQRT